MEIYLNKLADVPLLKNKKLLVMASLFGKNSKSFIYCFTRTVGRQTCCSFHQFSWVGNSILEGNSEIIINALNNGDLLNSGWGHLLKDTLTIVSSLKSWSFFHTFRQGNAVTDVLAKRVRLSSPLLVWIKSIPSPKLC